MKRNGFTLIEILVVIGITLVLAAIIFAVVNHSLYKSRETTCISNLRQIGIALKAYQSDYDELPAKLETLKGKYVTDKRIFLCPLGPPFFHSETNYSYYYNLFLNNPDGTKQNLWNPVYSRIGEKLPVVTCQYHTTTGEENNTVGNGVVGTTKMVLRMDGSVSKSYKTLVPGGSLSWYDF